MELFSPLFQALIQAGPYGVALACILLALIVCFLIIQKVQNNCLKNQNEIYKSVNATQKEYQAQLIKLVQDCTVAFTESTEATKQCTEAIKENGRNATEMSLAIKELAIRLERRK